MDFQQIRDFVNPAVAQATGLQEVDNLQMPVPVAYVPVQLVIDGALSLTSENPVQNKVIAVAIQNLDGRITAIEGQFSEGVTEAVNNWLAAHPEATTTVQDGAITYAKLDANLKGEVDQISELKSALNNNVLIIEPQITTSGKIYYINSPIPGAPANKYDNADYSLIEGILLSIGDKIVVSTYVQNNGICPIVEERSTNVLYSLISTLPQGIHTFEYVATGDITVCVCVNTVNRYSVNVCKGFATKKELSLLSSSVESLETEIEKTNEEIFEIVTPHFNLIDYSKIIPTTPEGWKYRKFAVEPSKTYYLTRLASGMSAWVDVFSTENVLLGNIEQVLGISTWPTTVTLPNNVGYIRILSDEIDAYANTMYWGYESDYDAWQNGKKMAIRNTVEIPTYTGDSDLIEIGIGTDYPTLTAGFAYARENGLGVIIKPGTYNLVSEGYAITDLGLLAPKKIYGYGVTIVAEFSDYTTNDPNFSPINMDKIPSCEIYGLTIKCKNARYCIHDELYNYAGLYHHVFKDLTLIHTLDDNTLSHWVAPRTIGGGIGNGGFIEIVNCESHSWAYEDINYHSNALGSQTDEVTIMIKDCALRKGASISVSGQSTAYMNKMIVTNCLSGKNVPDSTERNIKKISWNNSNITITEFDTLFPVT